MKRTTHSRALTAYSYAGTLRANTMITAEVGGLVLVMFTGNLEYGGPVSADYRSGLVGYIDGVGEPFLNLSGNTPYNGLTNVRGACWHKVVNLPRGLHSFWIHDTGTDATWGMITGSRLSVTEL
ncbi:MAG TPA: hypothetical protein VH593_24970 [Ktedonobacteraceae bacterium]|jgi:hypothetical protein